MYVPIAVTGNVSCDEGLDAVKSLPEFDGSQENMFLGDKQQQLHMNYSESIAVVLGITRLFS